MGTEGAELVCPKSGRVVSARLLRLHHLTHVDDVGVRVVATSFPALVNSLEDSVGTRLARLFVGSSPSDLTDSSSDRGCGETGREDNSGCLSRNAKSRHVFRASMRGDPSCRWMYLSFQC